MFVRTQHDQAVTKWKKELTTGANSDLLNLKWMLDIAYTDTNAKSINMSGYRGLVIGLSYNGFKNYAIYPNGLLSDAGTKVVQIEPDKDYYCIARLTTSISNNVATVKLNSITRHLDTVPTTINIYAIK